MAHEMQLRDVEGIEFYTDSQGDAGVSQTGLSILCGVPRNTINDYLSRVRRNTSKTPGKLTGIDSELFVNNAKIVDADTCVMAIEYYAFEAKIDNTKARDTFRKFAKIGFTKWVQTITGYEPEQAQAVGKRMTELEMAKRYVELLEEKEQTIAYLGDKPGLAHKMAQAYVCQTALPCELLSFDEMCDLRGVTRFETNVKRELSRKLANSVTNDTRAKVGTKTVSIPGKTKPQYYEVKAYPVEALAAFDNVLANHK